MRLVSLLSLLAAVIGFETDEQKAIKYIYNIGEQTNELRAKLMTVENDVKLNSVSVEKTRKYTELVHGAWQEALQLRQSLKGLNKTVDANTANIQAEEDARKATDRLLMDLFNSLLDILDEKAFVLNNLRKSGDEIDNAKDKVLEMKLVDELSDTKKALDKQDNQLQKQKAKLLDFDAFETKLYDLETALNRETDRREELEKLISHDEIVYKHDKDDMLDTLNIQQEIDDQDLTDRLEKITADFVHKFDLLKLNLTEVLVLLEDKDIQVDDLRTEIHEMKETYFAQLEEYRWEIEEMGNMTKSIYYNGGEAIEHVSQLVFNQTEQIETNSYLINDMLNDLNNVTESLHELEEAVVNLTTHHQDSEQIAALEEKVAALEYGVKIPPHKGEILITGGDGEYGPKWETSLLSTKFHAARQFSDMALPRSAHCTLKYRDEIYIVGGSWTAFAKLDGSSWIELDPMFESRDYGPGCNVYQDRIWVCGGHNGFNETDSCESWSPEDGWAPEASLLTGVSATTMAVNSVGLFVIGGSDLFGETNTVQYYDADAHVFIYWDELPVFGIKEAASVTVNDDIYLVGGYNNANNILQLDVPTQQWLNATTLENERIGSAAVAVENQIWIIGGSICFDEMMCADKIEIYDTVENTVYEKRIQHHVNVNFASAVLV